MRTTQAQMSAHLRKLIRAFVVFSISLVSISKISILLPSFCRRANQTGLCLTWVEILMAGFLPMKLIDNNREAVCFFFIYHSSLTNWPLQVYCRVPLTAGTRLWRNLTFDWPREVYHAPEAAQVHRIDFTPGFMFAHCDTLSR